LPQVPKSSSFKIEKRGTLTFIWLEVLDYLYNKHKAHVLLRVRLYFILLYI